MFESIEIGSEARCMNVDLQRERKMQWNEYLVECVCVFCVCIVARWVAGKRGLVVAVAQ